MSPYLSLILILLVLASLENPTRSQNPGFKFCDPQTCGNDKNISYPFYIRGKQEPFCGFPGFELLCSKNGFPILNLSNTHYIIQEIFYHNQSLRVSHPAFSASSSINCLPRPHNLTFNDNQFQLPRDQKDIFLLYGCDSETVSHRMLEYEVGCSEENETASVLALYKDDRHLSYALKNCDCAVVAVTVGDEREDIGEALRRGFALNWRAPDCWECKRSGGKCGFDQNLYTFQCYCPDRAHFKHCASLPAEKTRRKSMLAIATGFTVFGVSMLLIVACCFRRKLDLTRFLFFFKKQSPTQQMIEALLKNLFCLPIRRYSYSEIKKVTNSFKDKLGKGGYGSVYKGKLPDGRFVAVKVLSESKGNGEEFINEVASISKTSHVNIVNLLGFCFQGSKRALIYEFMPNGSLEKFIYEGNSLLVRHHLDSTTLYNIAIGVARGLEYLHRGCNTRILHFDIKPHNILLDKDFCPKISDFGLAKICPPKDSIVSLFEARGTIGYIAPEVIFRNFGGVSHKSDVYSYGMMVLEMVGGRKNINVQNESVSEMYFPHWIYKRLELKEDFELWCIKNEDDKETIRKMAMVSLWCIQTNPSTRPEMSKVVEMLERGLESLLLPPKPYFLSPSTSGSLLNLNI